MCDKFHILFQVIYVESDQKNLQINLVFILSKNIKKQAVSNLNEKMFDTS